VPLQPERRGLQGAISYLLEFLEARDFLSATTAAAGTPETELLADPSISAAQNPASAPAGNGTSVTAATAALPFDATLFRNKPLDTGMDNTLLLPSGNFAFWLVNTRLAYLGTVEDMWTSPDKLAMVAKAAWQAGYTKFCIDDEDGDFLRIRRNIDVIRQAVPEMQVGVFCFPQTYYNWTQDITDSVNSKAEIQSIMQACDFAVPGLDLRWDMGTASGRASWLAYLKQVVAQAEQVMPGKPCYPFLPIEYNPIVKSGDLTSADLSWQLQQVAALNCTPIIWGGFTRAWKGSMFENFSMGANAQGSISQNAASPGSISPSGIVRSSSPSASKAPRSLNANAQPVMPSPPTPLSILSEGAPAASMAAASISIPKTTASTPSVKATSPVLASTSVSTSKKATPTAAHTESTTPRRASWKWMLSPAMQRPPFHRVRPTVL
jgi:hypothetical protein